MAASRIAVGGGLNYSADRDGFASAFAPTGAVAQNFDRRVPGMANNITALTSGQMDLCRIWINAGVTVTNVNFVPGGTVPTASTHFWVALYDSSYNLLAQSTDDTTATPLTANTKKTVALSAAQTITASGVYHIGFMETVSAGSLPTFSGIALNISALGNISPAFRYQADTSLTTTAPNPATPTATAVIQVPYIYLT